MASSDLGSLEVVRALACAIDRLEPAWVPSERTHPELHGWVPLDLIQFLTGLVACGDPAGRSLLEVGCGIGTKMILAAKLGYRVHGIEVREHLAATARHLCPEATVEIADARAYDNYNGFDVVYCYRPIIDQAGQDELNAWIVNRMRSGSFLFLPLGGTPPFCESITADVWRKL